MAQQPQHKHPTAQLKRIMLKSEALYWHIMNIKVLKYAAFARFNS